MAEEILLESPDRRGTGSYKWDSNPSPDVLPMWVADMDFKAPEVVIEALRRRVDHGVFGYTLVGEEYYKALTGWFEWRHNWVIDPKMVIYTSGVVPAISAIIKALTHEGDGVIVQTPVYNCFFSSIRNNGCRIVDSALVRRNIDAHTFTYDIDFEDLERKAADPGVKVMLLCNPHNPAGRVWSEEELRRIAQICNRHQVRVISDEIHCELTMPGYRYVPYATVDPEGIACISPSKAFNLAGLQIANIVCPDEQMRSRIDRAININEVCDVNPFGVEALKAAYTPQGEAWLEKLIATIHANYLMLCDTMAKGMPQCPVTQLQATYLPWIDITALGISSHEMEERLVQEAGLWLNSGDMYGSEGYMRINIACPPQRLAEGLKRLVGFKI